MENIEHQISKEDNGKTLQTFIAEFLEISRNKAKAMLNQRNVFVNGRRVWMANHSLRTNDVVIMPKNGSDGFLPSSITILHEDEDYLIVDKKPGILSNGINSLETILAKQTNNKNIRVVHRLDKDTSGCLIAATSEKAFDAIIPFFRRHTVRKDYHVIVNGRVSQPVQTITEPIDEKKAITHIRVLDTSKTASHLLARIETGRTHQIRKHLSFIGHPVIGDRQYGTKMKIDKKLITFGRHMLHASSISLKHPSGGGKLWAKSPLPHDFRSCLKKMHLA
jgi:23S rRNA pseudouridine1911/1915/1917 synthase